MQYDFLHHRDKEPFENIKKGEKIFGIRLCDKKRQKIKLNNIIKVVLRNNEEDFFFCQGYWTFKI